MELGEKLLQARQEAGLSQRQLCGDMITRNMLSQIEHGTARPSMDTLRYLARKLGKPVSYFLEEHVVTSPNQELMEKARAAWELGEVQTARQYLKAFQTPDPILQWEWNYLSFVTAAAAAHMAQTAGKDFLARKLLEEAGEIQHGIPELERTRLLQMGTISGVDRRTLVKQLPSLDEELLLRAEAALEEERPDRAYILLQAAEDRETGCWNFLTGRTMVLKQQYEEAVPFLEQAEGEYPQECWPMLETCFRELGDYQKAYVYACKQR